MTPMSSRTVIVTGTSSGLGLDAAVYLADRGFKVYATMRNLDRRGPLDAAAGAAGVNLSVLQLDVTDPASVSRAVEAVQKEAGGVFAVVNNAGVQLRGFFEDLSVQEIRQVFDVNLFGAMRVARAVLPAMRQAGAGRLIFVSSAGGRLGTPALSAYCASKFGLEGFSEILALELRALGIQVSSVAPAIVRTPNFWGINRGTAARASDASSPYAGRFRQHEILVDRIVSRARLTPRQVSKTIHRALTAPRPRVHYMVGRRFAAALLLRRLLPGEMFERLYFGTLNHLLDRHASRDSS